MGGYYRGRSELRQQLPPPTNSAPPTNRGGNSHTSATPCGHCRQFLQELCHSAALKICINSDENLEENLEFKKLVELLSNPVGPFDLLDEKSPLLLEEKIDEALKAANNSHAPYSGCPSGVALMD
ncbi:hypothetical protein Leryth_000900 [Lithospermum erythrorhizon]|nr:hypothetical protein Leryth_000900 [Lithospermum erythrorhizon]